MDRAEFEAYRKQIEADEHGKTDLIAFIRAHDNYPKCLRFVGEQRAWLKSLKHMNPKAREVMNTTLELMGGRPLDKMSVRELMFLATWISGPAYLIDEISR